MSKKFYEFQPNDLVTQPDDLVTKQDALATGLGISISQNYSYKWNTSNFGMLYTKSVPANGQTVPAYTDVGCKSMRSDVDAIGAGGGYFPVKNGSTEGMGTATLVGQTDDKVISTSAALSITADGVSTACTPDASTGQVDVSTLFSSVNTSTDPAASGLLSNSVLDKGIVKVCNSIVGTPNATLETALGTAAS